MNRRHFALTLGIVYTAVGLLGFAPALLSPVPAGAPDVRVDMGHGYLLGLFPVNIVHTLVHLATGVWGLLAARSASASRTFALSVAILFGVLTVLGLIPGLETVFGLVPLYGHDVWLHGVTALAAAYFARRGRFAEDVVQDRERRAA